MTETRLSGLALLGHGVVSENAGESRVESKLADQRVRGVSSALHSRWAASREPRDAMRNVSSTPVKGWIVIVRAESTIVTCSDVRRDESSASKVKSRKPIVMFWGYQPA